MTDLNQHPPADPIVANKNLQGIRLHPSFSLRRDVWRVLTQNNPAYPSSKNEKRTT